MLLKRSASQSKKSIVTVLNHTLCPCVIAMHLFLFIIYTAYRSFMTHLLSINIKILFYTLEVNNYKTDAYLWNTVINIP